MDILALFLIWFLCLIISPFVGLLIGYKITNGGGIDEISRNLILYSALSFCIVLFFPLIFILGIFKEAIFN